MTDWDTYGPGRNGPYQKIKVVAVNMQTNKVRLDDKEGTHRPEVHNTDTRVIRICNRCGILYVQRDFNAGYCPLCEMRKALGNPDKLRDLVGEEVMDMILEGLKEQQDRQEETA